MALDPFAMSFDLVGKQDSLRTMGAILSPVKGCCFQAHSHPRIFFSAGPEPDQGEAPFFYSVPRVWHLVFRARSSLFHIAMVIRTT